MNLDCVFQGTRTELGRHAPLATVLVHGDVERKAEV